MNIEAFVLRVIGAEKDSIVKEYLRSLSHWMPAKSECGVSLRQSEGVNLNVNSLNRSQIGVDNGAERRSKCRGGLNPPRV